jgi:hypothetical protein
MDLSSGWKQFIDGSKKPFEMFDFSKGISSIHEQRTNTQNQITKTQSRTSTQVYLHVAVMEAKHLATEDSIINLPHSFVQCEFNSVHQRTDTVKGDDNPIFNGSLLFDKVDIWSHSSFLSLSVLNSNSLMSDDPIGFAEVTIFKKKKKKKTVMFEHEYVSVNIYVHLDD